jgi:glycosyltransferase involved in cell wall biosynthesis
MKVLFVVFEFQNRVAGGLGRVINGLSPELARLVELHVLAVFRHPLWLHQLQLHHFPGGGLAQPKGPPVLDSPGNFARLVLAEGGYDVVHFFYANEAIMTSKANVLRAAFPETKLVFSIHNLFKHEHPIRPCGSRFLRAEKQLLGLVDHVHVLNHASKRIFEQTYPEIAATRTLSVIHNGIEGDTFRASDAAFEAEVQRALPQGAKLVVCLSRWAPGKGLEHLLAAMAELCSERDDVYLAIAGRKLISWEKGSFGYVRRMDRMLAKLGRRVLRFGWLGEAQRNALFALAEVAVMPSELEYFPYGSTEPLHENVPLVQSRLPCLEEFFEDGVHCFFFEPRNVRDLAARLRWVLRDRAAARRMGAAGGQRLRSLSSWAVIARQYRAMYEQLERRGADAGELSPMLETEAEPIAEPLPELMRGAEPMKALLISFEFGEHVLGGLGRVINGLTAELRQAARLDIYLLYFDPRRLAISAKVYRCSSDRYGQLIETFTRGYDKHCVELIRREAYDIVHFFSVHWIIGKIIQRVSRELPAQKIV